MRENGKKVEEAGAPLWVKLPLRTVFRAKTPTGPDKWTFERFDGIEVDVLPLLLPLLERLRLPTGERVFTLDPGPALAESIHAAFLPPLPRFQAACAGWPFESCELPPHGLSEVRRAGGQVVGHLCPTHRARFEEALKRRGETGFVLGPLPTEGTEQ